MKAKLLDILMGMLNRHLETLKINIRNWPVMLVIRGFGVKAVIIYIVKVYVLFIISHKNATLGREIFIE